MTEQVWYVVGFAGSVAAFTLCVLALILGVGKK